MRNASDETLVLRATNPGKDPEAMQGWLSSEWTASLCTLTGKRHRIQGRPCEDAGMVNLFPDGQLRAALADGVSQGACGDLVARVLVNYLVDVSLTNGDPLAASCIQRAVLDAEEVVKRSLEPYTSARGAATMAGLWVDRDGGALVSHAGDCRLYAWRFTDNCTDLMQITQDHSYDNLGEKPPAGAHSSHPARMIGCQQHWMPPVQTLLIPRGTGVFMCSDGVHALLSGQQMAQLIEPFRRNPDMTALARSLAAAAMAAGGQDDISVLAIWRHD